MMIGANLRPSSGSGFTNGTKIFQCHANSSSEAFLLLTIALLGIITNVAIMGLIIGKASLRRWCHGLIFHQAAIDCTRATMLLPLAFSLHYCRPINQCNIFETIFLLLATVSAVNLLTTVLNDTPLMPDDDGLDIGWLMESPQTDKWTSQDKKELLLDVSGNVGARLLDAPNCVLFGISMIWFASITVNLGPTFITGALANHVETTPSAPSCTLIQTPYRHYIVNLLWVVVNSLCLALTAAHLYRLHRDLVRPKSQAIKVAGLVSSILGQPLPEEDKSTLHQLIRRLEAEGIRRIRMFTTICVVYGLFWGPLFSVIIFGGGSSIGEGRSLASAGPPKDPTSHQVMLYICFAHAFVNPTLFLLLHNGLKEAAAQVFCCSKSLLPTPCRHLTSYPSAADCTIAGSGGFISNNIDYARMNHFNGPRSFLPPPPSSPLRTVDSQTQSHMETVI